MITKEEYTAALRIVEQYRRQQGLLPTPVVYVPESELLWHCNMSVRVYNSLSALPNFKEMTLLDLSETPLSTLRALKNFGYKTQIELPHPTSSTQELLKYALAALDTVFAFGYDYQKIGVILTNFVPADHRQTGLFTPGPDERLIKLSGVVDKLNAKHGCDRVRLAQQQYAPDWTMRQQWVSKRYTTSWKEILIAR